MMMTVSETILFIFSLAYYLLLLEYQLYRNRDLGFLFNFFLSPLSGLGLVYL